MNKLRNRGICLTELLIALPLMAMLITGMIFMLMSMAKPYFLMRNNLEMQQQVRFAVDGIVRDITYGDTVYCEPNRLHIVTRRENSGKIVYALDRSKKSGRLMRDNQPVTGTGGEENISITEFNYSKWNERTVFIELKAVHRLTNKEFAVETAAVLLNQLE